MQLLGCNRWLLAIALLLGLERPGRAEEIRVTVVAILASTDPAAKVDPKVKHVAEEVQKREPTLKGFRLAQTTSKPLKPGQKENFPLVENQVAVVELQSGMDPERRVSLTVTPPRLGPITYRTCCSKFFPIVTGYKTQKDERLIVAIMVRPCGEK
ncbi:MAG: hypothetical protein NZ700_14565 [Gemmataceae bacterium]|nr:hypothetical protein [Gemmataceae bacterium]MDW8264714.1 hypothetical protein [Gemmataceae bacterium]